MTKKVIVVGAGPGGLAAALKLAGSGYDVEVYEKQSYLGGRNGAMNINGYTFDIGPTFLSMVHIVEELFASVGKNLHHYVDLKEIEPMYELNFDGKRVYMTRDEKEMKRQIAEHFPGNEEGYDRFMEEQGKKLDVLSPILQNRMDRLYHYASPRVLKALPSLTLSKTLYDVLSTYFTDERLKIAFTFQSKYLGMSPWECPGAFSILSYMEHAYGIFHPIGGVNRLSHALAEATKEFGGKIHLSKGVKQLIVEEGKVKGILLENGDRVYADEIVVNADFGHMATKLLPKGTLKKYTPEKLKKKRLSCSTFMIYLGVNKTYDLPHHTIVFAQDYKKNVEEITGTLELSEDPSIYIQNACVTDPTLAPEGKSALYILAPVPNNRSQINWEKEKERFINLMLDTLERKTEFKGLRDHIEVMHIITPNDWEKEIFVYEGATFNLGHQISQMMYMRPHNEFEELKHLYLVGGGTHPGSGLPTIIESARITARLIIEKNGQTDPIVVKSRVEEQKV